MITTNLYDSSRAKKVTEQKGNFSVIEYERDRSVSPEMAEIAYFSSIMDFRKRQLIAEISPNFGVIAQKGSMQLMLGQLMATTDVSGVGDLLKKFVGSKVTGESAVKPKYTGKGTLVLEPTFKHIILEDLDDWYGGLVIEDGMFLACDEMIKLSITPRTNISSAVLGGEGLLNTKLTGSGIVALESPVPKSELIEVILDNDTIKIDGNMAIAWSGNLDFTVERTTPTLAGSFMSGEGLVNKYEGTGKILIATVQNNKGISVPDDNK